MTVLEIRQLHLWRGEAHVLRGLSFAIDAGECLQLTGPNGSGKSTLLRVLCGLLPAGEGSVLWRGHETRRDWSTLQRECAYLGHLAGHKGELSALENLQYLCGLRRACSATQVINALQTVGLVASAQRRPLRELSAGQQRRVALARVLLQGSALWLLDEPSVNLDPQGQQVFHDLLGAHLDRGGLAVIATHQPLPLTASTLQYLELAA